MQNTVLTGLMIGSIALAGCVQTFDRDRLVIMYRDMLTASLCVIALDNDGGRDSKRAAGIVLRERGEDCK